MNFRVIESRNFVYIVSLVLYGILIDLECLAAAIGRHSIPYQRCDRRASVDIVMGYGTVVQRSYGTMRRVKYHRDDKVSRSRSISLACILLDHHEVEWTSDRWYRR